jgi:hypothetical protein
MGNVPLREIPVKTIIIAALFSVISVLIFKTAAVRESLVIEDCSLRGVDLLQTDISAPPLKFEVERRETIHTDAVNNKRQQRLVHAVLYVTDEPSEPSQEVFCSINTINRIRRPVAQKVFILGDDKNQTFDSAYDGSLDTGNRQCR